MTPEYAKDVAEKLSRYFRSLEGEQPGQWQVALGLAERFRLAAQAKPPETQALLGILGEIDALAAKEGIGSALEELRTVTRSLLRGLQ